MKKISFVFLFFSLFCLAQQKVITVNFVVRDSIFNKEGNKKIVEYPATNIKILLFDNIVLKPIGRCNIAGEFKLKLLPEDFNSNKKIVLQSATTTELIINVDDVKDGQTIYLPKGNSYYSVGKPAIYLYPEKKQAITIKLSFKGELGTTFPAYKKGWNVIANPNGELLNLADNRKYNYLFWEGTYAFPKNHFDYKDGYVVKKENLTEFLLTKLNYIGLNTTEINDFIIYWLPQLEKKETNFIHFWINDNIDSSTFLEINPKPNTEIVVFMEFKSVDSTFKIKEQILPKLNRKGFTVVEWGGTNLTTNKIE